jgi:long-subunit fatty acid transport protein
MSVNKIVRFLKYIFTFYFLFSTFYFLEAQTRISSPYTAFGLGDITYDKYLPNSAMGGFAIAYRNPASVNYINPASYTAFDSLSFVFQTGIVSDFSRISSSVTSENSNYTTLSNIIFGFPVTSWWRSSIGFLPYSNVGYKSSESDIVPHFGNTQYTFDATGGFRIIYFGNAFKLTKDLSVGFNASYIFGSIDRNKSVSQPDSSYVYFVNQQERYIPSSFYFNYGLQYTAHIKKNLSLTAGIIYAFNTNLKAREDIFSTRYILSSGNPVTVDTVASSGHIKGNIKIPQTFGFGLMLAKEDKWLIGADFRSQKWSKYNAFNVRDSLTDSWQASIGGEFIPDNSSVSSYFQKIHYRFGMHYAETDIKLVNTQLTDFGFSLGIVFPFKRTKTNLSVSIDLGQRGTTDKLLVKEEYANLTLCLNIWERWFFKRKYD